jgi:1-acyl-sn-glycerol-3-phosphate acyltransferase
MAEPARGQSPQAVATPPRASEALEAALRTAVGLLVLPATLLLYSAVGFGLASLGASSAVLQHLYVGYARLALRIAGIRLEVVGAERIERARAYVVVLNHESGLDPLCLSAGLPQLVLRFVIKRGVMRIPLLARALQITGNVSVLRTDTRGDVERLRDAMDRRDPEVSMVFFAEGTRSRDGALHAFKMGPFATALTCGLPILPVAIAGTYRICPKGELRLRPGPVAIAVGAPIPVEGRGLEDRARLRDEVHEEVAKLRSDGRRRVRERGYQPGGSDGSPG